MRSYYQLQDDFGTVPICNIKFNLKSRDDIPKLLTPELLDDINQVIVGGGHTLVKKKRRRRVEGQS
jgi:hypothetical protein